jgi:DNA-binding ferritin-like protein
MVKNATEIFSSIRAEVEQISADWETFAAKVGAELPDSYQAELQQLATDLTDAKDVLCDELAHPTLILATTGTTSSGKSTLVNLLCGAEILPVAVQEMSAGVVTVEYSETPALAIHDTPGAMWECGKWENLSDADIYDRLDRLMKTYLQSKEDEQTGVACPQSTIYYPFRLVKESNLLDLPPGTTVKIMDLPGLAYVGDEGNAAVIRNSRDALCLVTYNSAETDRYKVAKLLDEVVEQVKELGGSPARMLFVLNRIDVFRTDKDWPESEERFVQRTEKDIKAKLADYLPEYTDEIENVQIVKLSALPALLSLGMKSDRSAATRLDKNFNFLIPEDILDDLPRNVQKWSEYECGRVADAVWQTAYADRFHDDLKNHIQINFPQLIIPQSVIKFKEESGYQLVEWATQTTSAIVNGSEDKYQKECQNIEKTKNDLSKFIKNKAAELKEPFNKIDSILNNHNSNSDPIVQVEQIITKLKTNEGSYQPIAKSLAPIYDWRRAITESIEGILKSVLDSLKNGRILLDSKAFLTTKKIHVKVLEGYLQDLMDLNYKSHSGKTIEARTDEEKKHLQKLNRKLNELANILKLIIDDVAERILTREMMRVRDTLENLFTFHLKLLKTGTQEIALDLGINFSESELIKVDFMGKVNFSFEAGFPVTIGTWEQPKTVKTGTKRDFFTLWLWERDIYETKMEKLSNENAKIPSIDDLKRAWTLQKALGEVEVLKQVAPWFHKQLDKFNQSVDRFQSDTIDRYQQRLDQAYQENKLDYHKKMGIWEPYQAEAIEFAASIERLGKIWD